MLRRRRPARTPAALVGWLLSPARGRVWRLAAAGVVVSGAATGVTTSVWALVARRRPQGYDVVTSMSSRQARPDEARARDGVASTPAVLVHGLGMSSASMAPLVRALGRTTWTLAPDLPGYGRSPQPRIGTLGVKDLARTLLAWMDTQGVADAVLVGHSLGAQIAAEAALLAPGRIRRLVLVAPTGDPARASVLRQAVALVRGAVDEPAMLVLVAVVDYLRAGPGQMVVLMRRAIGRVHPGVDVTHDVPLLVVRGALDRVCTQAWCEQVVAATADSRLEVIDDAAHGIVFQAPERLVALLRDEVRARD